MDIVRICSHCGQMRITRVITPQLFLCSMCLDKYKLSRIDVDKMSEDVDDKMKTRTYIKPSQNWHIGHGLGE